MNAQIQRLRAEVTSDLRAFELRVAELETLKLLVLSEFDGAGALAQTAVALHHGYCAVEAALARVVKEGLQLV